MSSQRALPVDPTSATRSGRSEASGHDEYAGHASERLALGLFLSNPPQLIQQVGPPPIVVGDAAAAAMVRRLAVGCWEPWERVRIDCLSPDPTWVRTCATELRDLADVGLVPTTWSPDGMHAALNRLLAEWVPPPSRKALAGGAVVYVWMEDQELACRLATTIAKDAPAARVAVASMPQHLDQARIGHLGNLCVVDPAEGLPAARPENLLPGVLLREAGSWPDDVSSLFGRLRRGSGKPGIAGPGEVLGVSKQSSRVVAALIECAAQVPSILASVGIRLEETVSASAPDLLLGPSELIAVASRILEATGASGGTGTRGESFARALELASRLPCLVFRAGWRPIRPLGPHSVSSDEITVLAQQAHARYLVTSTRTANATNSDVAAAWEGLTAFDQNSSRAQVADIPVKLALAGSEWARDHEAAHFTFDDSTVETLAQHEHRRWSHYQRRNGRGGNVLVVPWGDLSEVEREYDREPVRAIPQLLATIGMAVVSAREFKEVTTGK